MNIFNKVTLRSLRRNKTRTIVTIIGIMLSAAMICAVTTFASSLQNYAVEYVIYNDGNWHAQVSEVDAQTRTQIIGDERIEAAAVGQHIGYAEIGSANEYKPYLCVIGGNDEYFASMPIHLISGTLPRNSDELLLPEHLKSNGGVTFRIGDTLTLELGERMLDGFSLGQNEPCFATAWEDAEEHYLPNGETLEVRETRRYTVVGFYERPTFENYTAAGYTALTVADAAVPENAVSDIYFRMRDAETVYDYMDELELMGTINTDLLLYSGVSRYSTFSEVLTGLAAIVIGLIMFGSISLIYNAFSISVSERTKQFGLLSSVGATKKQLRQMVRFEALAVSAVGIPLGILAGIGGIGVTLLLIGERFAYMMGDFDAPLRLCVSWQSIVIAVLVALVTVLISAWIPSKRATRVTAVEAIRQNTDIKARPARTSKLTYKLFGLPGVLASKYYKRSRKKYRATVVSLFMSIVLFVSAAAFTEYLTESVTGGLAGEAYDLSYYVDEDFIGDMDTDALLALLGSEKHITNVAFTDQIYFSGTVSEEYLTESFLSRSLGLAASSDMFGNPLEGEKCLSGYLYFIDDASFRALLDEYGLDEADYYDPADPRAVAVDNNVVFDGKAEKYITVDAIRGDEAVIDYTRLTDIPDYSYCGQSTGENGETLYRFQKDGEDETLELTEDEALRHTTLRTGRVITDAPYYVMRSRPGELHLIYPQSMMDLVLPAEELRDGYYRFSRYYMTSSNHAASYEALKTLLSENGADTSGLFDYAEEEESGRNLITVIEVFAYGFIVLISLIAAANVFNTISTNINLRRREFAMLKSVGMTRRGLRRMLNYECLLYGTKSLLYGLPAAAGVTWLICYTVSRGYETAFTLPWGVVGIAVFSVFAVVFSTMLYAMRRVNRENPIDALKNENL